MTKIIKKVFKESAKNFSKKFKDVEIEIDDNEVFEKQGFFMPVRKKEIKRNHEAVFFEELFKVLYDKIKMRCVDADKIIFKKIKTSFPKIIANKWLKEDALPIIGLQEYPDAYFLSVYFIPVYSEKEVAREN